MVWLCKPRNLWYIWCKIYIHIYIFIYICIYLYTQQDAHTYTFIYKETNRTAHMVTHKCALMFHKIKKKKQPYWLNAPPNSTHRPVITKIGRHAWLIFFFFFNPSMLPRHSPSRPNTNHLHSHVVHCKSDKTKVAEANITCPSAHPPSGGTASGERKAACPPSDTSKPALSPPVFFFLFNFFTFLNG